MPNAAPIPALPGRRARRLIHSIPKTRGDECWKSDRPPAGEALHSCSQHPHPKLVSMARHPYTAPDRPLVMIADGHDDTRELYSVALKMLGFETLTVDNGQLAFERARDLHPDVIVTEIVFPRHDGWSLVDNLKHDAQTRDIPIVVLTGHAEPSVRERAGREGCAALLVKPYLPDELAHALHEVLGPPLHAQASVRR
jgi:CheY-like chemotaxis protein